MSTLTMVTLLGEGFLFSLEIFAITLIGSLPLGVIIALGRKSSIHTIKYLTRFFISLMRGTPLMLQLLAMFFIPYYIFNIPLTPAWKMTSCLIAFVINYAAYFAEIYRSGIQSISKGQYEAAEILGYSKFQTFRFIIMPQVIKRITPAIGNEVITLVKDTSLAFVLGVSELMSTAKSLSASMVSVEPFIAAGIIYYIFGFVIEIILNKAEKKMSYYSE